MKSYLLLSLLFLSAIANAGEVKSLEDDALKIASYKARCEMIRKYNINKVYELGCFTNYNHYAPTSVKPLRSKNSALKIANYNLLHPGTSKALFKDYALVAKIMNQYDIVAGLELLATVGRDEQNNKAVINFLKEAPVLLEKLRLQRAKLKIPAQIKEMDIKIEKLVSDFKKAPTLIRPPGYLRVLDELKKLDPSWSLLLSPRGDSALVGSVEELVGFFYKAASVEPAINPHCKEVADVGAGTPVACFITLTEEFMDRDLFQHFARRPFMASFTRGNKKFTLVTSHMVYTYSGDEEAEKDLMMKTFNVESYKGLGQGINGANFARFAEVKNTLDFMNRYKKRYQDEKIMFLADTNLMAGNLFWKEVLKTYPGSTLLIDQPSTLSPTRYVNNDVETNGVANDYDHFILDKKAFPGCNDGEVYNYFKEPIFDEIKSRYIIRQEIVGYTINKSYQWSSDYSLSDLNFLKDTVDEAVILDGDIPPVDDPATIERDYPLTPAGQSKMDKFVNGFEKYLKSFYTVRNNEIIEDNFQIAERLDGMRRRVFLRQLTNPYYYRFMQEVLSDHFPVALTCKF